MRGIAIKNVLLGILFLAIVTFQFITVPSQRNAPPPDATVIQLWHGWSGEYADALSEVIAEFNRTHAAGWNGPASPSILAKSLYMPSGAGQDIKFFISSAGGVPPDVIVADGIRVATWASLGTLQPLDERMKAAGIGEDDFWEPCWHQCRYAGRTWALSAAADPNFAMVYNKHLFRQAGLDPERPPRTLAELEDYCDRLTTYRDDGRIEVLGIMPTYGAFGANAVFTWGWAFGGRFYDDETETFTPDHPRIVKAMEWILRMRDKYGGSRNLKAFQAGLQEGSQHPFYIGKFAMQLMYIADAQNIAKFAPSLEYGIAPMPGPEDGEIGSGWIGGWTIGLPRGRRGNDDAAFELVRWMTADPHGTAYMARRMKLLPAYKKSPFFDEIAGNRILEAYYGILQNARHVRPVSPASMSYIDELNRAMSRCMEDIMPPREALAEARERTQEALRKIRERQPREMP